MSRRHADLVDVVRRDDAPAQFLWHERLYQVREVLSHWVEAGRWWSSVTTKALVAGDGLSRKDAVALPTSPSWARGGSDDLVWSSETGSGTGSGTGSEWGADDGFRSAALDDGEREFWRVEARAGRSSPAGVFDLCFDWSAGSWQLVRVVD